MLNTDQLINDALAATRSDRFTDQRFMEHLDSLVVGLNREARLNEVGIGFHASRLTDLLANRLRLERWVALHPDIRKEKISRPIVVIGLPRTGTTMLHRSIAADALLLAPLWYEVRQPSPLNPDFEQQDDRIPVAQAEVQAMLEASPELAAIHPMDAIAPDEEIMLLEHAFMSTVPECYAFMPDYGGQLYEKDQSDAYDYLYLQLQFLQWQKRKKGLTGERWVLKTPHHIHYPEHLFERFPDAVVIQTHRHPVEVIPSYGSMMSALASPFTDKLDPVAMAQHWANKWQVGLAKTREFRDNGHDHHYLDLWFQDSVSDPEATIRRIYEFTGQTLTEGALTEMARWRDINARENRPEHHYQLADYGFTAAGIEDQFGEYISRHAAR